MTDSTPRAPALDRPPPDTGRPAVSIVIATYDRSNILGYAIGSVLAQTRSDWELLVIGDGCTDGTAEFVAALGDPRIRYVALERVGDQSGPTNEGVRLARGRCVALLNHDDLWLPDHRRGGASERERLDVPPRSRCARRSVAAPRAGVHAPDSRLAVTRPARRSEARADERGDDRRHLGDEPARRLCRAPVARARKGRRDDGRPSVPRSGRRPTRFTTFDLRIRAHCAFACIRRRRRCARSDASRSRSASVRSGVYCYHKFPKKWGLLTVRGAVIAELQSAPRPRRRGTPTAASGSPPDAATKPPVNAPFERT